jgi:hypothetical protein
LRQGEGSGTGQRVGGLVNKQHTANAAGNARGKGEWREAPWPGRAAALVGAEMSGCAGHPGADVTAPAGLRIVLLTADPAAVAIAGQSVLTAQVENPGGGELTYSWTAYQGPIVAQGPRALYYGSACCLGTDQVVLQVRNGRGEQDTRLITMTVHPAGG